MATSGQSSSDKSVAENIPITIGESCLNFALEGERLCKAGNYQFGIKFFQSALNIGTDDLGVLSAIYSQIGNAYFYERDFANALEFHRWDFSLTRSMKDFLGEIKACANLNNCYKMLGKHTEAVICCQRQLDLCRRLNNKVLTARALYNLGNAYHSKGRQFIHFTGSQQLGELSEEARSSQENALLCYSKNLLLVCEIGDRPAEGRAYGNIGNTHYLLGNFTKAVEFYKKRLQIAKEFGDLQAQRRAYSNLGNGYIFLDQFLLAARSYKHALNISRQLGDETFQAQACYSLGNSCTLLRDYSAAVVYYLRHLQIVWRLKDKINEGRGHWSLANAYAALGDYQRALKSSLHHRQVAKELADSSGLIAAELMIVELRRIIGDSTAVSPTYHQAAAEARALEQVIMLEDQSSLTTSHVSASIPSVVSSSTSIECPVNEDGESVMAVEPDELSLDEIEKELSLATSVALHVRQSKEDNCQLSLLLASSNNDVDLGIMDDEDGDLFSLAENESIVVVTAEGEDQLSDTLSDVSRSRPRSANNPRIGNENLTHSTELGDSTEFLFDLLVNSQASRMEDQRCALNENETADGGNTDGNSEDDAFLDLLIGAQSSRMNDQRAELSNFPGLVSSSELRTSRRLPPIIFAPANQRLLDVPSTNNLADRLRIRSASDGLAEVVLSSKTSFENLNNCQLSTNTSGAEDASTEDGFFEMILRLQQSTRINDQRSLLPERQLSSPCQNTIVLSNKLKKTSTNINRQKNTGERLFRVLSVPSSSNNCRNGS